MEKLENGEYLGLVKYLVGEVKRLENLLEESRRKQRVLSERLMKAEHDRDRYARRIKEVTKNED